MISQYIQFCQEEKFEPLSRTTLFKILEAGQASQRKSFQDLDNTAADGSAGFQKIEIIVDDLEKGGMNRQWCAEVKERLKSRKRYLKTNYRVYRNTEEALCPDHCRKFALSDEQDPDFQEKCSHQHTENCNECQNLRNVLDEVADKVRVPFWIPYDSETRGSAMRLQAGTDRYFWVEGSYCSLYKPGSSKARSAEDDKYLSELYVHR